MLKVGVIGMRGIGNTHAEVYHSDALSELVAVCDMVKERADEASAKYNARPYYSVREMLKNEALDLVGVCTGGLKTSRIITNRRCRR